VFSELYILSRDKWLDTGFGFTGPWKLVTTIEYNSFTYLQAAASNAVVSSAFVFCGSARGVCFRTGLSRTACLPNSTSTQPTPPPQDWFASKSKSKLIYLSIRFYSALPVHQYRNRKKSFRMDWEVDCICNNYGISVNRDWAAGWATEFGYLRQQKFFVLPRRSGCLLVPLSLRSKGTREILFRVLGMKLTAHLHLAPRLVTRGAKFLLPYTSLLGNFYFYVCRSCHLCARDTNDVNKLF
jgi:hypothetical protein